MVREDVGSPSCLFYELISRKFMYFNMYYGSRFNFSLQSVYFVCRILKSLHYV